MTKEQLIQSLDYVNATREKRMQMTRSVMGNPKLLAPLLQIAFEGQNPVCDKACWILEYVVKQNPEFILPYINNFTQGLHTLKSESSIRPMAKICEILTKAFFSRKPNNIQTVLSQDHLERMASACFDWLIGDHKVASKAYSMTSLFLLGKTFDWIHPELKLVLEQNYASGSSAYKARARMTLEKLNALKPC